MNLFKKYRVVLREEYKSIKDLNSLLNKANGSLASDLKNSQKEVSDLSALIKTLQNDKDKIIKKYNDVSKRKDKLREQVNELKKEVTNLSEQLKITNDEKENIEKEFAEFKKNKFIVKKIHSAMPRKTQAIRIKSSAKTSKIIKDIKEK